MIIFYDSLTGQTKSFAERLKKELEENSDTSITIKQITDYTYDDFDKKCFLLSRSFNFGQVPDTTLDFLDDFKDSGLIHNLVGQATSGNKNWGQNFGKSGTTIQEDYGVPLVLKFEARGFPSDVRKVAYYLKEYLD